MRGETVAWAFYFAGNALAGFGSAYYHLKPDDDRIIWDRLPVFMYFVCKIIYFLLFFFYIDVLPNGVQILECFTEANEVVDKIIKM